MIIRYNIIIRNACKVELRTASLPALFHAQKKAEPAAQWHTSSA